jgi:hypothetical protein
MTEQNRTLRWKRIEPGYYRTTCGRYEIANMRGQSVLWSGLIEKTWELRHCTTANPKRASYGDYKVSEVYATKAEAQAAAEKDATRHA